MSQQEAEWNEFVTACHRKGACEFSGLRVTECVETCGLCGGPVRPCACVHREHCADPYCPEMPGICATEDLKMAD